jgi:3-hydroxyisobutyrate dehydrogenase-like beta-hydroxyacid dehydrogenase
MLGLPSEVDDVILGRSGLLRNLAPGSIVIDMSTSRPELACRIAGMAHTHTPPSRMLHQRRRDVALQG